MWTDNSKVVILRKNRRESDVSVVSTLGTAAIIYPIWDTWSSLPYHSKGKSNCSLIDHIVYPVCESYDNVGQGVDCISVIHIPWQCQSYNLQTNVFCSSHAMMYIIAYCAQWTVKTIKYLIWVIIHFRSIVWQTAEHVKRMRLVCSESSRWISVMPNGLQMCPNLITGPLCVNTQRALKWINPTDMFSSPTVPAFKSNNTQRLLQYIISTSADISHPVFEAIGEPDDWKKNRKISFGQQNQSVIPQTQWCATRTFTSKNRLMMAGSMWKASMLGFWKVNHHKGLKSRGDKRRWQKECLTCI